MSTSSTDGPGGTGPYSRGGDTGPETTAFPASPGGTGSSSTGESWPGSLRDPDAPAAQRDTAVTEEKRSPAHLPSIVLSLVLTPVALALLDYSVIQGWPAGEGAGTAAERAVTALPMDAWIPMAVAAAVLLVVGFLGRLSALGPLLAGLVWGAAPAVLQALRPDDWVRLVGDLPQPWTDAGDGLLAASPAFVVLGALLVGTGLAGRWRARTRTV